MIRGGRSFRAYLCLFYGFYFALTDTATLKPIITIGTYAVIAPVEQGFLA
jgi:hypothetical protein